MKWKTSEGQVRASIPVPRCGTKSVTLLSDGKMERLELGKVASKEKEVPVVLHFHRRVILFRGCSLLDIHVQREHLNLLGFLFLERLASALLRRKTLVTQETYLSLLMHAIRKAVAVEEVCPQGKRCPERNSVMGRKSGRIPFIPSRVFFSRNQTWSFPFPKCNCSSFFSSFPIVREK